MSNPKILAVIPARYKSTRLPGKMLIEILGKSLIQRTYENISHLDSIDEIVVATDDEKIFLHVQEFGGKALMTSPNCLTGSDRVAEVVRAHYPNVEIVVNVQGDEPCLNPSVIMTLIEDLKSTTGALVTTPVTPIKDLSTLQDPSVVKCVFDNHFKALYFSRHPIPFERNSLSKLVYYRHLGVYCFKRDFLLTYQRLPPTPLQQTEDLEQLKILEAGFPVYVSIVQDDGIGVDTINDLKRLETRLLCTENIYS